MVCSANELLEWKDFPKGLRVLLLVEDYSSASQITSKLQQMDYIVVTFYDESEAMLAISNNSNKFHIAIVEVSTNNSDGRFKFLEKAKDLPTIMTSEMQCLSIMMKCIALGAVEFLKKPLSEDKLRNIWQHVAHKAFNVGRCDQSESPTPFKESLLPIPDSPSQNEEQIPQMSVKIEEAVPVQENVSQNQESGLTEVSAENEKYPAPSTPQIKQGIRLLDDGDQTNLSTDKDSSGDHDGESKSVEITNNSVIDEECIKNKDEELGSGRKDHEIDSSNQNGGGGDSSGDCGDVSITTAVIHSSCKGSRKRVKVDWTAELHKKFVQAVEQLGVDQAIPSRILEVMKVEGLTRHNVASHLQKYRMQRRHILPKEEERRWPTTNQRNNNLYHPHNKSAAVPPVLAFPPNYHSNHIRPGQFYPPWVPPNPAYQPGVQMWPPPYYPPWQPADSSWHWKPYPALQADTWGCPIMPAPLGPCPPFPQNNTETMPNNYSLPQNPYDSYPGDEVIDRVVKEAISKPWLPLPLGLKPPSTDTVLTELSRQGISTIPPRPC